MKKVLLFLLIALFPMIAFADVWQDPETKVNYTYTPGNTNASVKAGDYNFSENAYTAGSPLVSGDVQIRSEFVIDTTTYIVSSIGYSAFANCNGLTSIRIPSGLKQVGNNAFNGCNNLSSIHIPESLTKIDDSAFEGCDNLSAVYIKDLAAWCNVTFTSSGWSNPTISNPLNYAHHLYLNGIEIIDLQIPEGVTTIKSYAFCGGSSIKSIHVPEGVKTIKEGAFKGCSSLTNIYLPKSLTICEAAFDGCDNLSSVHIEDIAAWCEIFWGYSDLSSYYGNGSEYANPLTKAHHLFINGEEVKDVFIPDGVKRVRDYTFAGGSNFSSIRIPPSLTITGMGAFKGCSGLERVDISDLESWCNIEFYSNLSDSNPLGYAHHLYLNDEEIQELTIPESITEIKNVAFYGCWGFTSVTIGDNVKSIGNSAFEGCNGLKSLHIPNSVKSIESRAFSGCGSLLSITVDEDNEVYDSRDDCNAIIYKSSNVLMLGCSNSTIPNSVNKIGDGAFSGCKGLTSIVFPPNITGLGYGAFRGCSNLNVITSCVEEPFAIISPGYNGPFEWDTFSSARLYVPEASLSKYKNADVWNYFHDIRAISNNNYSDTHTGVRYSFDDTNMTAYVTENQSKELSGEIEILSTITVDGKTYQVTTISGYAFFGCENISSLIIPEGLTSIEKYAFFGCKGLTSITIPESVTNMYLQDRTVFSDCSSLTSVTILCPKVGTWFRGNETIKEIKLGENVLTIENEAFDGCSSLTTINIPSSVSIISRGVFKGCASLCDINISEGVTNIGSSAFYGCTNLTNILIPSSVTTIGNAAFSGCSGLASITLSEGLESIGYSTFYGCKSLTSITLPSTLSSIDEWAFHGCEYISKVTSLIKEPFPVHYTAFAFLKSNSASSNFHPAAELYVPYGTIELYKNTEGWKIFDSIYELAKIGGQSISLQIIDEHENIISDGVNVAWFNIDEDQIGTGNHINGIEDGTILYYSISFDEELGRQLKEVNMKKVIMGAKDTTLVVQLEPIGKVVLQGRVSATDIDKASVIVNVKQMLNGKYELTYNTKTDEQGVFSIEVYDDETEITISGDGYLDTKIQRDGFGGNGNVGTIPLNLISGFAITANIKLKKAVAMGQEEETTEWSAGLNNIEFVLYNETKNSDISDFTIQNGNVIIKTGAEIGDKIRLTAKSKQEVFADASTIFTIAEGANNFSLVLTELGGLDVTCSSSSNSNTIGYLYNSNNTLIVKGGYVGETLSLRHLHNGTYTLVSMGGSTLLGNITSLSNLSEVGLNEGSDYVATSVVVTDGVLTEATINEVPRMDDTRFYYTSNDTYFNANKESLTSGNYLTLSAHIDFKPEYSDMVDMMNLSIEIPEGCQIVENSVIANRQAVAHTVDGNRLRMTLNREQWQGLVRFCIIPTLNQSYTITAMASFDINGKISQPIGTTQFEAKGLSLSTPKYAASTNITINGTAKGHSEVSIYDNDVLIGKTSSKADGSWTAACELYKPYNHSFHEIYAKITTENGMELTSETRQVEYDKTMPIPQMVTMLYNGKNVIYDLLHGVAMPVYYTYVPSVKNFTFLAEFTCNDTTLIKNVNIKVLNSDGTVRTLPAQYDGKQGKWVATTYYSSSSKLPVNVLVEYDAITRYTDEDREVALQEQATLLVSSASLIGSFFDTNVEMTTIDEGDDYVLLECNTGQSGAPFYYRIENVDYQVAYNMMKVKQFVYTEGGDGVIGTFTEIADNSITVYVVDVLDSMACKMTVYMSAVSTRASAAESNTPTTANTARTPIREFFGSGRFLDDFLGYFGDVVDLLTGIKEYWNVRGDFDNLCNVILSFSANLEAANKKTFSLAMAKCPDGSYRLSQEDMAKYHKAIQSVQNLESSFRDQYYLCLEQYKTKLRHSIATYIGTLGLGKALGAISKASKFVNSPVNRWFNNTLNKHFSSYVFRTTSANILSSVIGTGIGATVGWGTEKLDEIFSYKDFNSVRDKTLSWSSGEYCKLLQDYTKLQDGMKRAYKTCEKKNDDEESNDTPKDDFGLKGDTYQNDFMGKGSTPEIDPSGYVYEAVLSNRLEGVTTTCYQKVQKEDMYGDITEEAIVWNAADYSQQNPLKTDAAGFYRWDVPQGMWQVKYEKEGYETVYSEWLPVPPPQLDVNVGMKQSTPPTVKQMRGYESGINIEMSKYMRPVTLNTTNVTVTRNGMAVKGSVEIQNLEKEPYGESEFASKMRFVPESAFNTTDEVVVTVHKEVESYCSVNMESNYVQIVKIEPEIKEIVADSVISIPYQNTKDIQIVVLPKTAAVGKTLRMKTSSAIIASLGAEEVVLDDNGSAIVSLTGELPGGAYLTFTVDETDIVAQSKVNVVTENDMVALPVASIRSGESVEAGTLLTLTCDTEGATIYYTLDGSCPCDEAARIKYEAPIVINSDVIVKAIAVKDDMDDSDIATFVYILSTSGIADNLSGIRIWPYITSSLIHIDLNDLQAESITIANLNGVLIYSAENASGQITVDLGKYADGMYIVNVKCNDGRLVRKIIKVG